jgi:hypothetical protein
MNLIFLKKSSYFLSLAVIILIFAEPATAGSCRCEQLGGFGSKADAVCIQEITPEECQEYKGVEGPRGIVCDEAVYFENNLCGTMLGTGEVEYEYYEGAVEPNLSVPDFNVKFSDIVVAEQDGQKTISVPYLAEYIAAIYQYMVGIATILAIVMIMYGGFRWITAAGNPETIGRAKDTIVSAIIGLAIALGSYTILNLINPNLVEFKALSLISIEKEAFDTANFHPDEYDDISAEVLAMTTDEQWQCVIETFGIGKDCVNQGKCTVLSVKDYGIDTSPPNKVSGLGQANPKLIVNNYWLDPVTKFLTEAGQKDLKIWRAGSLRPGDRASNYKDPHNYGMAWDINVPLNPYCPKWATKATWGGYTPSDEEREKCLFVQEIIDDNQKELAQLYNKYFKKASWYGERGSNTKSTRCVKLISKNPFLADCYDNCKSMGPIDSATCPEGYVLVISADYMHFQVEPNWKEILKNQDYRNCRKAQSE